MSNELFEQDGYYFAPQNLAASYLQFATMRNANMTEAIDQRSLEMAEEHIANQQKSESSFIRKINTEGALSQNWPPDLETQKHFATVSQILKTTEQKTGVAFSKMVAINPGSIGFFAIMGKNSVFLDYSAVRGESLEHKDLANIINHEAAHIFYRDNEISAPLSASADYLNQISVISELHHDNPNLFYKYVQDNFSSLDEFEEYLTQWNELATEFYMNYEPFIDMKHQAILEDHYSGKKVQTTLENLPESLPLPLHMQAIKSGGKFPLLTKKQAETLKERMKEVDAYNAQSEDSNDLHKQQIELHYGSSFTQDQTVEIDISVDDKSRIDKLIEQKIVPIGSFQEKLKTFQHELRLAAEFRADDFCVIFADHPKTAYESLQSADRMMKNIQQEHQSQPSTTSAEELDPHPPLPVRIERQKKLGEYVAALRAEKGPDANLLEYLDMSIGAINRLPTEAKPRGFGLENL